MTMAGMLLLLGLIAAGPQSGRQAQPALEREAALLDALEQAGLGPAPAPDVTFRELWSQPEAWRNRSVTVRGRIARRFSQPAVGPFPALSETWLLCEGDNILCLVYPALQPPGRDTPLGASVSFQGRSLGKVTYAGADQPRLAPLVAGPQPPTPLEPPGEPGHTQAEPRWPWSAIAAGAAILGLLAAIARIVSAHRKPTLPPSGEPAPFEADFRSSPGSTPDEFD